MSEKNNILIEYLKQLGASENDLNEIKEKKDNERDRAIKQQLENLFEHFDKLETYLNSLGVPQQLINFISDENIEKKVNAIIASIEHIRDTSSWLRTNFVYLLSVMFAAWLFFITSYLLFSTKIVMQPLMPATTITLLLTFTAGLIIKPTIKLITDRLFCACKNNNKQ